MALASKKSEAIHSRDGAAKAAIKANFDAGDHTTLADYPGEAAMLYQIQQMQEDIDELRRYIISAELLVATSGGNLPTTATSRGSGLLWNNRGAITIG